MQIHTNSISFRARIMIKTSITQRTNKAVERQSQTTSMIKNQILSLHTILYKLIKPKHSIQIKHPS